MRTIYQFVEYVVSTTIHMSSTTASTHAVNFNLGLLASTYQVEYSDIAM